MSDKLDAYAAELLERTVEPLARTIRAYGPDALAARWWTLSREEQQDTVALLAAAYPVDDPVWQRYAWHLGKATPEHADERYEAPRPLVIARAVADAV